MATYPGVQDRLAAELDGAGLLATPTNPEPKDVDFNVLHELPVLDAVSPRLLGKPCVLPLGVAPVRGSNLQRPQQAVQQMCMIDLFPPAFLRGPWRQNRCLNSGRQDC